MNNNQQLLDEVKYDIENFADRSVCYAPHWHECSLSHESQLKPLVFITFFFFQYVLNLKTCLPRSMESLRLHNNCPFFGSYKIWRGIYLKILISIFLVLTWKIFCYFLELWQTQLSYLVFCWSLLGYPHGQARLKKKQARSYPMRIFSLCACRNKGNSFNHITVRTVSMWSVQILIF